MFVRADAMLNRGHDLSHAGRKSRCVGGGRSSPQFPKADGNRCSAEQSVPMRRSAKSTVWPGGPFYAESVHVLNVSAQNRGGLCFLAWRGHLNALPSRHAPSPG
jgi:hypothetical protein